jgi:hypothetical protein
MAARFAQAMSTNSTNRLNQVSPVGTSRGSGKSKTGGMPGYIKTAQDKSAGGLNNPSIARGGKIPQSSGPRSIPSRKGENRRDWQDSDSLRGSSDKSYRATSTAKPGKIRPTRMPMKPASRSMSEKEGPSRGEFGSKTAVLSGGVLGANKLPAGGAKMGRASGHATMSGGKGSAPVRGQHHASPMRASSRTGRGTMEKLAGKGKYSESGITSRRKSMMY